jgi:hypothetical protein
MKGEIAVDKADMAGHYRSSGTEENSVEAR